MNPFERAVAAHDQWRTAFERAIREGGGELEVDVVGADGRCLLGLWLSGEASRAVTNPTALAMLRDIHAEFHAAAAAVLAMAQAGRVRDAIRALGKDPQHQYRLWSETLLHALNRYADAESGGPVDTSTSTTG